MNLTNLLSRDFREIYIKKRDLNRFRHRCKLIKIMKINCKNIFEKVGRVGGKYDVIPDRV